MCRPTFADDSSAASSAGRDSQKLPEDILGLLLGNTADTAMPPKLLQILGQYRAVSGGRSLLAGDAKAKANKAKADGTSAYIAPPGFNTTLATVAANTVSFFLEISGRPPAGHKPRLNLTCLNEIAVIPRLQQHQCCTINTA